MFSCIIIIIIINNNNSNFSVLIANNMFNPNKKLKCLVKFVLNMAVKTEKNLYCCNCFSRE